MNLYFFVKNQVHFYHYKSFFGTSKVGQNLPLFF